MDDLTDEDRAATLAALRPTFPHMELKDVRDYEIEIYIAGLAAGAKREREAMQAKIDALMLEYCPEEMTPEQLEKWCKHQVAGP